MYFLKTKGTSSIPDFVQIRDENFALIAHFKLSQVEKNIKKLNITLPLNKAVEKIKNAEYEKITKLD